MESMLPLIINLISGAVGGNVAGGLLKNLSLGTTGNSIIGILGGGAGGALLSSLGIDVAGGGTDIAGILGSVASGGVGGGALMAIIGVLKNVFAK